MQRDTPNCRAPVPNPLGWAYVYDRASRGRLRAKTGSVASCHASWAHTPPVCKYDISDHGTVTEPPEMSTGTW
jgi:hypothetical protein